MSVDIVGKLKTGKTIHDVALWVQAINAYVGQVGTNPETGEDYFPRLIKVNPDAVKIEDMIGDVTTPPDVYGRFMVRLTDYEYLDWSILPMDTAPFTIVSGKPAVTGSFA